MRCIPLDLTTANKLVEDMHRHHGKHWYHKFTIGLINNDNNLIGAAICNRPATTNIDNHSVLEVVRLVTDGTPNACSKLYSACARAAKAMGYWKIQTYILKEEPGTSLKASGWICEDDNCGGGSWTNKTRKRNNNHPLGKKQRWALVLNEPFNMNKIKPLKSEPLIGGWF